MAVEDVKEAPKRGKIKREQCNEAEEAAQA
ncbi:hypothetical protein ABIC63_003109 [Pseudacidovorax sp. 1753]